MRIYLSGPMTGLPEHNYPAFHAAEAALFDRGYEVINPARPAPDGWEWLDYMRRAVRDVSEADGLAMLPGWINSRGARIEHKLATSLGLPAWHIREWVNVAGGAA